MNIFNHELSNPRLFNHELSNPGFFHPRLGVGKSGVGKFMVEKSGVEKSRVEMFFNPTEIFEEIVSEEENLLDNDYPEAQTESEQRGISYQMFKWIIPKIQQTKIAVKKI